MKAVEILLLLAILLAGCSFPRAAASTPAPTAEPPGPVICRQSTIDALSALHGDLAFPGYLIEGGDRKRAEEFDANETFSVLTHLSMEPGYALDYVYYSDFMGGEPILYARPEDQEPYLTYSEFKTATGTTVNSSQRHDYLDHVRVDGTDEGFFELALFHLMGGQFYLYWHAGYNDATALCDRAAVEEIISRLKEAEFGQSMSAQQARQARALDLEPSVAFDEDAVTVKFVFFTMWGGFLERTYTFARDFPHRLVRAATTELVSYDCGVLF